MSTHRAHGTSRHVQNDLGMFGPCRRVQGEPVKGEGGREGGKAKQDGTLLAGWVGESPASCVSWRWIYA